MNRKPRALVAEEGIKTFSGHWTPYNAAIAKGFAELGWETMVAGHREAHGAVRAALPFAPVFRFSRWDGTYEHRLWFERRCLVFLHNWRLYRDMSAFLETQPAFELVFCGNLLVYHSLAWRWLARRYLGRKFHRLTLMMVQPAGSWVESEGRYVFPWRSGILAWSLASAVRHGRGAVTLAAETPAAAMEFAQLTGHSVTELHHPVDLPPGWEPPSSPQHALTRIICPGFARYEKGSDLLLEAIRQIADTPLAERIEFILQWPDKATFALADGTQLARDETLTEGGLVRYVETSLGGLDYWNFLASGNLLVLPYRRNPYTTRLSRVAIEAMLLGKPVVYPDRSWLASAIEAHGAGVSFPGEQPKTLSEAIETAVNRLPALREAAERAAPSARHHYSARRFAERLANRSIIPS